MVQVETTTDEPRLLVVSEMYFPGWDAYIDGRETMTYRTNYLFRGVVVPAGRHTVTFVYRPASVVAGGIVSALALVVVGVLLTVRGARVRDRRKDRTMSSQGTSPNTG
jgi:uncharacterized membrane protein YfhO